MILMKNLDVNEKLYITNDKLYDTNEELRC